MSCLAHLRILTKNDLGLRPSQQVWNFWILQNELDIVISSYRTYRNYFLRKLNWAFLQIILNNKCMIFWTTPKIEKCENNKIHFTPVSRLKSLDLYACKKIWIEINSSCSCIQDLKIPLKSSSFDREMDLIFFAFLYLGCCL